MLNWVACVTLTALYSCCLAGMRNCRAKMRRLRYPYSTSFGLLCWNAELSCQTALPSIPLQHFVCVALLECGPVVLSCIACATLTALCVNISAWGGGQGRVAGAVAGGACRGLHLHTTSYNIHTTSIQHPYNIHTTSTPFV